MLLHPINGVVDRTNVLHLQRYRLREDEDEDERSIREVVEVSLPFRLTSYARLKGLRGATEELECAWK